MRGNGVRVLVVGAGIAGLAVARMLHAWGATVQVAERTAEPVATGAGIYLPGNAVRALAEIGLAAPVAAQAVEIQRQRVTDWRGRLLLEFDVADLWEGVGPCLALPRANLHQVLLSGVKPVPIRWSCSPTAISDTPDHAYVEFNDGTSAAYDLVVGADGVHSTVRRIVFGPVAARTVGQHAYRFLAPWPDAPPVWSAMLGHQSVFLTIPVDDQRVYCYCDSPLQDPPPSIPDLLRGYAEPVPSLLNSQVSPVHSAPNEEVALDTWSRGLVLLVGDAAHATSPNLAQGAAMACEDAIVLAQSLTAASSIAEALQHYKHRRRRRTRWVRRQTHRRDATRRLPPALRHAFLRRYGHSMFRASYQPLRDQP